jgi:uncharacterized protein YaiI (UPF0178 family)
MEICRQAAAEFGIELLTVANFNHQIQSSRHLVVGDEPQAADIRVANLTRRGDVVVTQDWGLAALVIGKGASALGPTGRLYREQDIDFLLESRDLKARYRRSGGHTRGPKKRTSVDDQRFKGRLYALIQQGLPCEG